MQSKKKSRTFSIMIEFKTESAGSLDSESHGNPGIKYESQEPNEDPRNTLVRCLKKTEIITYAHA